MKILIAVLKHKAKRKNPFCVSMIDGTRSNGAGKRCSWNLKDNFFQCSWWNTAHIHPRGFRLHQVSLATVWVFRVAWAMQMQFCPFCAQSDGQWDHLSLYLSVFLQFYNGESLWLSQIAVGKMSTQILEAMLPQSLYFPCGSPARDRCLAGRFSFMLLDQTKAYNLQEFKCSNSNILALPSLNSCIINISWKNGIIKVLFL